VLCFISVVSGIAYVTYSKASEAALAIEQMHGKTVKDKGRPVKVGKNVLSYC